jgi:YVTN family beta-propeller protein
MRKFVIAAALVGAVALLRPAAAASRFTLIVLSHGNHTVYEVDPDSGRTLHTVVVPGAPDDAAIAPDGRTIYVTIPGAVTTIDAGTFRASGTLASLPRSATPNGLALTDDGTTLYAGVEGGGQSSLIAVDVATKKTRTVETGLAGGASFGIQPGSNKLYYPFPAKNTMLAFDSDAGEKLATVPVKGGPADVGFAPNGDVWVQGDGDGSVAVVSSFTDKVQQVIRTTGRGAGRIAVSPSGQYAASTHAGSQDVTVFNARTRQVSGTVHLGQGPAFPVFSADSTKLFVMNRGAGDVAVIDTRQLKVIARWKIGREPFGGGLRYFARR